MVDCGFLNHIINKFLTLNFIKYLSGKEGLVAMVTVMEGK